jgi:PAS domain S-box-containing protein
MRNLTSVLANIEEIKHQLTPNGGSSLRDAVDRIETRMILTEQRAKLLCMDSPMAVFEADAAGEFIHVNRTFARWTGRSQSELTGNGWVNTLSPADRVSVYSDWLDAISQEREFTAEFSLRDADGAPIKVHCSAFPMLDRKCTLAGWMGTLNKIPATI